MRLPGNVTDAEARFTSYLWNVSYGDAYTKIQITLNISSKHTENQVFPYKTCILEVQVITYCKSLFFIHSRGKRYGVLLTLVAISEGCQFEKLWILLWK